MGKRGPSKKPSDLKVVEGTYRKDRDGNEPKPAPKAPKKPSWLPTKAKYKWNELAPKLERLGLLREVDGEDFARYCLYTIRQREAEEDIQKRGILVPGSTPGTLVKNPAVQISRDYGQAAQKLADKFGLNPSARSDLKAEPIEDDDPMEELLSK